MGCFEMFVRNSSKLTWSDPSQFFNVTVPKHCDDQGSQSIDNQIPHCVG